MDHHDVQPADAAIEDEFLIWSRDDLEHLLDSLEQETFQLQETIKLVLMYARQLAQK